MPDHTGDIEPLDPGRINSTDPAELQYWSKELGCTEAQLKEATAKVGEHLTAVREHLRLAGCGKAT